MIIDVIGNNAQNVNWLAFVISDDMNRGLTFSYKTLDVNRTMNVRRRDIISSRSPPP